MPNALHFHRRARQDRKGFFKVHDQRFDNLTVLSDVEGEVAPTLFTDHCLLVSLRTSSKEE